MSAGSAEAVPAELSACGEACGLPDHGHRSRALGSRRAPWSTLEKPAAWKQAKAMSTRQQRCVGPSAEPALPFMPGLSNAASVTWGAVRRAAGGRGGPSPGGCGQGL